MLLGIAFLGIHHVRLTRLTAQLSQELKLATARLDSRAEAEVSAAYSRCIEERDRALLKAALKGEDIQVTGTTADGHAFDWTQYRGKPVLLHFWAAHCLGGPCPKDFPALKELYSQYEPFGLEVVSVCADGRSPTTLEISRRLWADQNVTWEGLLPTRSDEPRVNDVIVRWPMTYILVGEDGKAVAIVDRVIRSQGEGDSVDEVMRELRETLDKHVK